MSLLEKERSILESRRLYDVCCPNCEDNPPMHKAKLRGVTRYLCDRCETHYSFKESYRKKNMGNKSNKRKVKKLVKSLNNKEGSFKASSVNS